MDIPSMSIAMSSNKVMQQAAVSVTKKALDLTEVQMQGVVDMMRTAAPPSGHRLDVRA